MHVNEINAGKRQSIAARERNGQNEMQTSDSVVTLHRHHHTAATAAAATAAVASRSADGGGATAPPRQPLHTHTRSHTTPNRTTHSVRSIRRDGNWKKSIDIAEMHGRKVHEKWLYGKKLALRDCVTVIFAANS